MKTALISLAVLLLIGGGVTGFFLVNGNVEQSTNDSEQTSQTSDESETEPTENQESEPEAEVAAIVQYDGSEFSPANVTVEVGSTVRFVNNGTRTMWVASDDHPSHTDLSEFDNKGGVGPGETYEFTFDEAGNWGYHDHLNAAATGVVEVTAAE